MLIGISGKIGVGKTTLANEICKLSGFTRTAFGDVLKREVSERFGFDPQLCYSATGKEAVVFHPDFPNPNGAMTVRQVLQWYGTDVCRKQHPGYWVRRMNEEIPDGDVIIDDVRFPDEADFVRDRGGLLVRLLPYPEWIPGEFAEHKSETALDGYKPWDLVLAPNFGGLPEMAEFVLAEFCASQSSPRAPFTT
jgi:hypothetical protein